MQSRTVFLLLPLSAALSAQTPITLTHGATRFDHNSYANSTTDIGGYCNFTSSGVDHAYQSSWYYALASDATGSAFNSSGGQLTANVSTDGRTGELLWLNVDQRNFSAVLTNAVYSTGANSGVSAQTMTISNNMDGLMKQRAAACCPIRRVDLRIARCRKQPLALRCVKELAR